MPPRFEFEFSYRQSPRIISILRAPSTQRFLPTYVLLDTGADMSLFDLSLAEALGIDLTSADSLQVTGVGGAIADARVAPVEVELLGEPELRVTLAVAFGPMAQLKLGNLVGLDILEQFDFGLSHRHRLGYLGAFDTVIRAVLFDVGGPLDLEVAHEAAIDADIRAGLAREGIAVGEAAWDAANAYAVASFAPSVYKAVIWYLSGGDPTLSERIYASVEERSHARDLFEVRPGIAEVLEALKQRGLKLGLVANQPESALSKLERAGLRHYFGNEGVSGVHGYRKPDVRLFLRACSDFGVEPGECIMVGDRVDLDVVPAKLLGMRTVLLRTGRHIAQQPRSWDEAPDVEVHSAGILNAIEALLDQQS